MQAFSQSPTSPAFVQDPYPFYSKLHDGPALSFWTEYDMPVAAHHATVSTLLKDRRFGRENPCPVEHSTHLDPFYAVEAHSMLELEPPRHTRLRGLVLRAFTSRRIASLAPEIAALSHQLIDAFPKGEVDLISAFAQPIPVIIIARLLGVPEERAPDLLRWSNAMVAMYQAGRSRADEDVAVAATEDFRDFLTGYIEMRRRAPRDDLISHLIAAEEDGQKLSHDELISTCILLLNAGHEATVHTLGNVINTLMQSWSMPEPTDAFVEEALRHDPPLHLFTRYALQDVEVFGHRFQRGAQVGLLLAAANRDPSVYPDPGQFASARFETIPKAPAPVSFGGGIHFCVGAPLARLEIKTALPILFERYPHMLWRETPVYADRYHFRGLEQLIIPT